MGYIHDWKMKHLLKKQKVTAERMRMAQQEAVVKKEIVREEKVITQAKNVGRTPGQKTMGSRLIKGFGEIGKDLGKSMSKNSLKPNKAYKPYKPKPYSKNRVF